MLVLPIFAALDPEEQMRVFVRTPPGKRKVEGEGTGRGIRMVHVKKVWI